MDLRQIRYFLKVAEELNISRAAEKLFISQPPLSRALIDLEKELGCKLMKRGGRHITLTPEGLALRMRAEQLFDLLDKTRTEISELGSGMIGTLYLGHVDSNGPRLACKWIKSFQKTHPNICYNLWCGNADDLTDRLESGLLDLAITMTPLNSEVLDGFPVFEEFWIAMIPKSHPLAQSNKDSIDISELADTDLIISSRKSRLKEINSWFAGFSKKPRIRVQIAHSSNAIFLVEQGIGIGIFPASVAKNIPVDSEIVVKKITPEVKVTYLLSWLKKRTPHTLAQRFIDHIRERIEEESTN